MRILVISDTHGKNERVYDVYNKLASAGGPAARLGGSSSGLSGGSSSGLSGGLSGEHSDCLFGGRPAAQPGSHRTPPVDMIVHCGDYYADAQEIRARLGIPVLAVKGNCDGCFDFEACSLLETECGDILITHGHMEDVGFSMQKLYYKALESGCIGAFFGHTHRSVFVETGGVYLLNPGSLSQPRDGSGGTFALVTTSEAGLQAKIYYYEDFMLPAGGVSRTAAGPAAGGPAGGAACMPAARAAQPAAGDSAAVGSAGGAACMPGAGAAQPAAGDSAAVGSAGGGADAPDNSAPDKSAAGGTDPAPETTASSVDPAVQKPKQKPKAAAADPAPKRKPKVKGGHLRSLINYSDRF